MNSKKAYIYLSLVALAAGIIWRAELEWHGWHGLIWLSYFHYAIPINFILVLSWINLNIKGISPARRIWLNSSALIYTFFVAVLVFSAIYYTMIPGARGFVLLMSIPRWAYSFFLVIPLLVVAGFSWGVYWILLLFKQKAQKIKVWISMALLLLAFPIASILLKLVQHRGGSNFIHAIKSGFVFPLLVFSIGVLVIGIKKKEKENK